jgi:Chitinase A, N-terminal domain
MLGVDPVDGCTFWATLEYTNSKSLASWRTRIAAFSLPGCGSGPAHQVPAAPSNLTASAVSSSQVNLAWSDNSDNETRFEIQRNSAALASVSADVTSYSDTTVRRKKPYSYTVRACNANGCSAYSDSVTIRIP